MFDFELDTSTLGITALVFSGLALCVLVYAMIFTKAKRQTQVAVILFNVLMCVSVSLMQNWIMTGIHSLASLRDIVFIVQDKYFSKSKKFSFGTLGFFMTASVVVGVVTFGWWFDVFLVGASMFVDYGSWAKGVHKIRISRFIFSCLAIVNFLVFFNPISIAINIFAIGAIVVYYLRYFKKRDKMDVGDGHVAQSVAHVIGNDEATGSNPVVTSITTSEIVLMQIGQIRGVFV